MSRRSLEQLQQPDAFTARHIGPAEDDIRAMLGTLGTASLDELVSQTVPPAIRLPEGSGSPEKPGLSEPEALSRLKQIAGQNTIADSYIGMGYYPTHVPNVILRNVLENPGWYTAYTPYQPELSQGRLEALLNYQQMTLDLTGMELANASLLDEATAAAEAMAMAKRVSKNRASRLFYVDEDTHPQTLDVLRTRAAGFGFELKVGPAADAAEHDVFGAMLSYPGSSGQVRDLTDVIAAVQARKGIACVAADLMSLLVLKSPGAMGADVVFGSSQRFGVPMGFGGPHAAFFAARDAYKRAIPGRIIGVSQDRRGNRALRMALQTREQHIRREKANSNICTAQVLLANMAAFYAVYHGPQGLRTIAERIGRMTDLLAAGLQQKGLPLVNSHWFDTLTVKPASAAQRAEILARAEARLINLRTDQEETLGVSLDETTTPADLTTLFDVLLGEGHGLDIATLDSELLAAGDQAESVPAALQREVDYLQHPVFNRYHCETEMMRYLRQLEGKDLALNTAMIPLGSCTMKLNAAAEMIPISWPEFTQLHPFCPPAQAKGYHQLIDELSQSLIEITGYDALSMQPNSGAQGEYAGLLAIQGYHASRGEQQRNVCLIPGSAHGTNPASAQMLGLKVVVVACDEQGNVDLDDLRAKAEKHSDNLSCVMITYPSTHGVYEPGVIELCDIVHQHGGQVYLDGANLNAQVGLTSPGLVGADVSHLNLHKTFAIPHGGGGPGMGPIGVKAHLAPFLPGHSLVTRSGIAGDVADNQGAVSAAPFGSAAILPISWMYINLLGSQGLRRATEVAILNANYVASRLSAHYPVLYTGSEGRVAHECILDIRPLKEQSGISELDIAKRLMDYGFHAPTMSFPVAGTLMVEPTESESRAELDRLIEAMIAIRQEIAQVEQGVWPLDNNPLVNAPHTQADLYDSQWSFPYSRELAAFPSVHTQLSKQWPSANRLDDVYGDRNLFCACVPMDECSEAETDVDNEGGAAQVA